VTEADLTELVGQLARLPDEQRRDVTRAAGVQRQHCVKAAVRHVKSALLAGWSGRKVARAAGVLVCYGLLHLNGTA
jgi:hypothetical protein